MDQAVESQRRRRFDARTQQHRGIGSTFPATLIDQMQELAKHNGRSMKAEIERALRAHLAHNQE